MQENVLIWVSLLIVLSNIYLLGTSRLGAMIHGIGFQGVLMSVLPLLTPHLEKEWGHLLLLALLSVIIKGYLIPSYLHREIMDVEVKRELNPYVGYFVSVLFGLATSVCSIYVLKALPICSLVISPIHASTALASILIGSFLIATRRNVIAQIVGFLVFENAGFILGVSVALSQPLFIEIGVLFDLVAGVAIMGASLRYIRKNFNTLSVHSLERLHK